MAAKVGVLIILIGCTVTVIPMVILLIMADSDGFENSVLGGMFRVLKD